MLLSLLYRLIAHENHFRGNATRKTPQSFVRRVLNNRSVTLKLRGFNRNHIHPRLDDTTMPLR